ncbi:MAG: hypothetical protein VX640_06870 [Pseudomonadota bacterium]|nr:hypothetical protein [Pseudomonadota bacterium]
MLFFGEFKQLFFACETHAFQNRTLPSNLYSSAEEEHFVHHAFSTRRRKAVVENDSAQIAERYILTLQLGAFIAEVGVAAASILRAS